jgi:hypothetical protein
MDSGKERDHPALEDADRPAQFLWDGASKAITAGATYEPGTITMLPAQACHVRGARVLVGSGKLAAQTKTSDSSPPNPQAASRGISRRRSFVD